MENMRLTPLNVFIILGQIAGLALGISIGGIIRNNNQDVRLNKLENRRISICTTCKSEFYSEDLVEYIKDCPNCPMSDEEFQKLIDDINTNKD